MDVAAPGLDLPDVARKCVRPLTTGRHRGNHGAAISHRFRQALDNEVSRRRRRVPLREDRYSHRVIDV
jgi:hypothetical protein